MKSRVEKHPGGRPAKFAEPSRPVTVTLPERVLQLLAAVDADLAWSHARFRDADPAGRMIPGAPQATANVGVTVDHLGSWFGALRWRYFGPRPLLEDGSVKARASSLLNLRLGYRLSPATQVVVDVFNLLDQRMNDIEYWYESRLANEPAAVADRHLHPAEPRNLRFSVIYRF